MREITTPCSAGSITCRVIFPGQLLPGPLPSIAWYLDGPDGKANCAVSTRASRVVFARRESITVSHPRGSTSASFRPLLDRRQSPNCDIGIDLDQEIAAIASLAWGDLFFWMIARRGSSSRTILVYVTGIPRRSSPGAYGRCYERSGALRFSLLFVVRRRLARGS